MDRTKLLISAGFGLLVAIAAVIVSGTGPEAPPSRGEMTAVPEAPPRPKPEPLMVVAADSPTPASTPQGRSTPTQQANEKESPAPTPEVTGEDAAQQEWMRAQFEREMAVSQEFAAAAQKALSREEYEASINARREEMRYAARSGDLAQILPVYLDIAWTHLMAGKVAAAEAELQSYELVSGAVAGGGAFEQEEALLRAALNLREGDETAAARSLEQARARGADASNEAALLDALLNDLRGDFATADALYDAVLPALSPEQQARARWVLRQSLRLRQQAEAAAPADRSQAEQRLAGLAY